MFGKIKEIGGKNNDFSCRQKHRTNRLFERKNYISIACDCWFTASGEIHPRFFKVQEDGDVITVPIKVIHSQEKYYFGVFGMTAFKCSCIVQNKRRLVYLYFFHEEHIWKLEWIRE